MSKKGFEIESNKVNAAVFRAIAQKFVLELESFDKYLRKQKTPRIYKRFQRVIKIVP